MDASNYLRHGNGPRAIFLQENPYYKNFDQMNCQKDKFRLREGEHYLNCGYKAPLLRTAEEACRNALIRNRNPMDIRTEDFFSEVEEVKGLFSKLVGGSPDQMAVIPSCSYGFGSVLSAVPPKTNGKAITLDEEFPSGYFALKKWCNDHQQDMKVIKKPQSASTNWSQRIMEGITSDTSLVLMSSIHWMTGYQYDLAAIGRRCREVGAYFIVDGTQSVGALDIDVKRDNIDALICAAYKWLLGPYSLGMMYVGDPLAEGSPLEESWMNRNNAARFSELTKYDETYKPRAGRYNVGETTNFLLMPMLKTSLTQILEWDVRVIPQYVNRLKRRLELYLQTLDEALDLSEFAPHLVGISLPSRVDPEALKTELTLQKVSLSNRGDQLRISFHLFNDQEDVDALIQAIENARE